MFLTRSEKILWRVSSSVVAGYPALGLVYFLAGVLFTSNGDPDELPTFLGYLFFVPVILGPLLYVAARVILLALPLAALRHLPEGTYRVVQWSTFIPHIG